MHKCKRFQQYLIEFVWSIEEISASLDDSNERNEENGQELQHRPDLPNPWREVEVSCVCRPVEHLGEVAGLEGHDAEDHETDGKKL